MSDTPDPEILGLISSPQASETHAAKTALIDQFLPALRGAAALRAAPHILAAE